LGQLDNERNFWENYKVFQTTVEYYCCANKDVTVQKARSVKHQLIGKCFLLAVDRLLCDDERKFCDNYQVFQALFNVIVELTKM